MRDLDLQTGIFLSPLPYIQSPIHGNTHYGAVKASPLESRYPLPWPHFMNKNPFRYFKTSPEIIQLAVMMYVRFPLSLRNVEDLLHKRGTEPLPWPFAFKLIRGSTSERSETCKSSSLCIRQCTIILITRET